MSVETAKIYEPETIPEMPLPEVVSWETLVGRPDSLADLDKSASDAIASNTAAITTIDGDITDLETTAAALGVDVAALQATDALLGDLAFEDLVTELLLANQAVTNAKIAINAIQGSVIAAQAITNDKIGINAIQGDVIAAGAITETKIDNDSISTAKIQAGAITGAKIAAGSITASKIVAGTITATEIAANTITAAKIQAGTITSNELAANSVTATQIQAGSVTASKISVSTLSAISANIGAINAGTIDGITITGGTIRTASSGTRVELSGSANEINIYSGSTRRARGNGQGWDYYNPSGSLVGSIYADSSNNFLLYAADISSGKLFYGAGSSGSHSMHIGTSGSTLRFFIQNSSGQVGDVNNLNFTFDIMGVLRLQNGIRMDTAGHMTSGGTLLAPSLWSGSRTSTGIYSISHGLGTTSYSVVCVPLQNSGDIKCKIGTKSSNSFTVRCDTAGVLTDMDFMFILVRWT